MLPLFVSQLLRRRHQRNGLQILRRLASHLRGRRLQAGSIQRAVSVANHLPRSRGIRQEIKAPDDTGIPTEIAIVALYADEAHFRCSVVCRGLYLSIVGRSRCSRRWYRRRRRHRCRRGRRHRCRRRRRRWRGCWHRRRCRGRSRRRRARRRCRWTSGAPGNARLRRCVETGDCQYGTSQKKDGKSGRNRGYSPQCESAFNHVLLSSFHG
jgi:hypothetical protein